MKRIALIWKKIFATFQSEEAFTLLEILFSFMVFTVMVFFISPLFTILLQHNDVQKRLQTMEWEVFCSQIKKEIRMSTKIQVVSNHLELTEDTGTITYEKYENLLRRRVNNTGHEVMFQNISAVKFTLISSTLNITAWDLNQREYKVNVYPYISWSAAP